MRKYLIAASAAALATAVAGLALAQDPPPNGEHGRGGWLFQSDTNQDGAVTRAEYDAGQTALFTRLDANSDGALTREEHRGGREHARRGGGHHRGMSGSDANNDGNVTRDEFLARPIAMFDRMDANDDGVISEAERPQRRERPAGEQRRERMNPDANNDGSISQAEFTTAGASRFQRLDANSDGRVTREEAEAARPNRRN